ncbi:hypothetical protein LSTR_LSTR009685 [Laodelphax striatellus]|uniref:HAUS augmin-like complex subunit 3 N-terminal domain-containing protein n=1 Tax=Laodelphax striatellus TaxID=195883 RepID=A0A482WNM2_LAOST|nr:hypothetical protein LSTR_LSTR009685 [Laodelphax striatellus]
MGDIFVDSLRNFLQQTGYEDVDSIDLIYYEEAPEDCGISSIFEFLSSQITEDNFMRKDHLEVAEKLKGENVFLDEAKTNKKLIYASQLDALPPITEVDIDCCKSELFELKKQSEVLQNLKDCLNIEFEELKKTSEVIEQRKLKCDTNLNKTLNQCTELYARYDSIHETANQSFKLHKNSLKDISLNKKLKKDFLFQVCDNASLRMNSTVLKKSLLKLARKIGFSTQASDLNSSFLSNSFSLEAYNRIFNTQESNFIDEFEKNKLELKLFCVKLQQAAHLKTTKLIEKDSFSTELELLRKMNSDIEGGSLQLAALKEDMEDIAEDASEFPGGWGDENCADELTSAVDVVCAEWMKSQMLQHLLSRLEQRAVRRERLLEQLDAFTNLLQTRLVFDDMLWMLLVCEKNCITSFIQAYKSTMHQSSKELAGFKQRMKIMEKMLENNSIEQPEENVGCIGQILSNEDSDKSRINKVISAIDDSIKLFDGIGSKFLCHMSKLSKVLDNRYKEISSFNKFIHSESGNFLSDDDDIGNIQNRISQLVENIEIVSKLVDDKEKYFESKPFEKDYTLAWALFLTNKEKLKGIVEEIEREARHMRGGSIT